MTCMSSLLSADFEGAASDSEWQRFFGMNVPANGSSESSNQMRQRSCFGESRFRTIRWVRMRRKDASSTDVPGDSSGSYPIAPCRHLHQRKIRTLPDFATRQKCLNKPFREQVQTYVCACLVAGLLVRALSPFGY